MKAFAILGLVLMTSFSYPMGSLTGTLVGIALGKIPSLFSSDDSPNLENLKEVLLITNEDTKEKSALRVHIVIVFKKEAEDSGAEDTKELLAELSKMSTSRYFSSFEQLIRDHPGTVKIFEWGLIAKKEVIHWRPKQTLERLRQFPSQPKQLPEQPEHLPEDAVLIGGFVFADYDRHGDYRARIPNYERVKITFGKKDFNLTYEDETE